VVRNLFGLPKYHHHHGLPKKVQSATQSPSS
jgi:hypothetical protein